MGKNSVSHSGSHRNDTYRPTTVDVLRGMEAVSSEYL